MKIEFETIRELWEKHRPKQTAFLKSKGYFERWINAVLELLKERAETIGEEINRTPEECENFVVIEYMKQLISGKDDTEGEVLVRTIIKDYRNPN